MSWVRVSLKETRERKGSMVSFRTAPAPKEANFFAAENSSLKRKFGELDKDSTHVELQMERPLPLEWQQCLDLQVSDSSSSPPPSCSYLYHGHYCTHHRHHHHHRHEQLELHIERLIGQGAEWVIVAEK